MKYLFLLITISIIFVTITCVNRNKDFRENFINSSYAGEIVRIYNDKNNHDIYIIYMAINNSDTISVFSHVFPGLLNYITIGDFVFKEKEDIKLKIQKENGSTKNFPIQIK